MPRFQSVMSFPSAIKALPDILAFVEDACGAVGVDPVFVFDLQLAVEEACSNVIEHAYRNRKGGLTISFETRDRDVLITLRDQGRPFDPKAVARPDVNLPLGKRPIGGLGLHLMYQLMDDVCFTFDETGNTLAMVKRNAIVNAGVVAPPRDGDG